MATTGNGMAMSAESNRAIAVLRAIGRVRRPLGASRILSGGRTVSASQTGRSRTGRRIRAAGSARLLIHEWATDVRDLIHEWATDAQGLIPGGATRAPMPRVGPLALIRVGVTQTSTASLIAGERRHGVTTIACRVRGRLRPRRRRKARRLGRRWC